MPFPKGLKYCKKNQSTTAVEMNIKSYKTKLTLIVTDCIHLFATLTQNNPNSCYFFYLPSSGTVKFSFAFLTTRNERRKPTLININKQNHLNYTNQLRYTILYHFHLFIYSFYPFFRLLHLLNGKHTHKHRANIQDIKEKGNSFTQSPNENNNKYTPP